MTQRILHSRQGPETSAAAFRTINWHAINHDPAVFEHPEIFGVVRFRRNPELASQHRAFGNGEHFCIGAHMSRLEIQMMLEELVPRLRNPAFAQPVEYVRDYFVNGIKSMRLSFDAEG